MTVRRRRRNPFLRLVAPLLTIALLGYFGFHALHGQHGIRAHLVMAGKIDLLTERLATRQARAVNLAARLSQLQTGSMERDMIDEYARRSLGMAQGDELVVLLR